MDYIFFNGKKIKVNKKVKKAYYKYKYKERYFMKNLKQGNILIDTENEEIKILKSRECYIENLKEFNFEVSDDFNLEEFVILKIEIEKLRKALKLLKDNDLYIIENIYFLNKSKRTVANDLGISHTTLLEKEKRILKQLNKILLSIQDL
nr:hypothetical protein [uncultured Tyzzerella sp.]